MPLTQVPWNAIILLSSCQIDEFLKLKFIGDERFENSCTLSKSHAYMDTHLTTDIDLSYLLNIGLAFLSGLYTSLHR